MRPPLGLLCLSLLLLTSPAPAHAQGVYPDIPPREWPPAPVVAAGTALSPGDVFRDCEDCPDMVVVPAGVFVMGSDAYESERPRRVVRVRRPFAIARFEITHDDWQACVDAGGCDHRPDDHGWGRDRRPVINVSHAMATGYARWLSARTGERYRLPSETEWEYAARAGTTTEYWFGDAVGTGRVNCRQCGTPWSGIGNAPVGSFAANPWGLHDMHGNAFEWVADCWHPTYRGAPEGTAAWVEEGCPLRVIRGGSWYYFSRMSRSANRQKNPGEVGSYWLSFRVVRELR